MRPSSCALASCYKRSNIESCHFLEPARHYHILHLASRQVCDQQAAVLHHLYRIAGLLKVFFVMIEVYGGWLMRLRRSNLFLSQKYLMLRYTIVYKAFCYLCLPATQNGHTTVRSCLPIRPYCERFMLFNFSDQNVACSSYCQTILYILPTS
jgi:hypothetical protein